MMPPASIRRAAAHAPAPATRATWARRAAWLAAVASACATPPARTAPCAAPCRPPAPDSERAARDTARRTLFQVAGDAQRALQAGDHATAVRHLEHADALAPAHPTVLLYLARARLQTGDSAGAERALLRIADVGVARPLAEDSVLGAWAAAAPRRALVARLAASAAPRVRSDTAVVLDAPDLLVESIAVTRAPDGARAWLAGSMRTGSVRRVAADGATTPLTRLPARTGGAHTGGDAGPQPLGLKVDGRGRLWVNVTYPGAPGAGAPGAGALPGSALLLLDASTGATLRRVDAPADGLPHQFNDLVIAPDGEVLLTDTRASRVYRLAPGGDALAPLEPPVAAFSVPNGIALSPDAARLYVAHAEGITVWDRRTNRGARLAHPDGAPTTGIDGLYACRGGLVAVQSVADFSRVVWLRLDPAGGRVVGADVLEQRHPAYADPTTGALVGDTLHYVASSEVRRLRPDGTLAPPARPSATVVLRLPLGGRCSAGNA